MPGRDPFKPDAVIDFLLSFLSDQDESRHVIYFILPGQVSMILQVVFRQREHVRKRLHFSQKLESFTAVLAALRAGAPKKHDFDRMLHSGK